MLKNRNIFYIAGSLMAFIIVALLYAHPVLTGKEMMQHDIVNYKGGAKELLDYRATYGKETYWSDAMFGGMPTYQTGSQFRGDLIKQLDKVLLFLPKPANYIFLLFSGFFLLGMVTTRNWKYALLGASFFGLSTYFYIIIAAGHNGKVHTVAYFAPLLAGILLVYIRRKYIWGFIVTTLFMGLQVAANHPQMTYYLFLALAFLLLSELFRAYKGYIPWRHFWVSTTVVAFAFVLGVGMNSQRIMANMEYAKESVRGKQILESKKQKSGKSGLDKESITMWSYGKLETLNLFIPRLMGGGSQEKYGDDMMGDIQQLIQENAQSQNEVDNILKGLQSPTYWGEQPGTSGPAYQGAVVVFLATLGFFLGWKKYRYWILSASILAIFLAWGSNFMFFSDLFIDFVPLYNKFRAPSSILVVTELLFPLIAIIGLYRFFNSNKLSSAYKKETLLYVSATFAGLLLLFVVFGKMLFPFLTEAEQQYLPPYLSDYLVEKRHHVFRIDALRSLALVISVFALLFFALKNKISQNVVLIGVGLLSMLDLWSVNQNYLNAGNFVDKSFARNPFQTESSDLLISKAGENPYVGTLLSQTNINNAVASVAEKDPGHYRIFNTSISPFNETNTSYFKSSVGGYHAAKLRRYDDLINEYFMQNDSIKVPRILNMLNTKYIVVGGAESPEVAMNPQANGNAWFVSQVEFVNTAEQEISRIGEIDSKMTAVVHAEDKNYFKGKNLGPDPTARITLKEYKADELQFISVSKTGQLAVFSEIYYPHGWKIFIDGKQVEYIKANYLLRAVYVPAGQHSIKMVFEPEVIEQGKIISYGSFGLFILAAAFGLWWQNRRAKQLSES